MFNEATFINEVINEYHNRLDQNIDDIDINDIIDELIVSYPDFHEYSRIHYANINNVSAHLYYKISDLLDEEYYSDADTYISDE